MFYFSDMTFLNLFLMLFGQNLFLLKYSQLYSNQKVL